LRGDDVVVQLGLLKVTVPKSRVKLLDAPRPAKVKQSAVSAPTRRPEELNLRGARVEEGLEQLRDFLLEAHALKAPSVRILHGKGTGALRDAVRGFLKDEKRVERFEDAVPYEGGHGVTVAYLRH
jgi:DNA mismatch repair protein MutS2